MFGKSKSEEEEQKEIAEAIAYEHSVLTPYNVNPKSEIIESFQTITSTSHIGPVMAAAPLLTLAFSAPKQFTMGILSDSLLIVADKPKKTKFESIRIFWNDLDKYKLKIIEFSKSPANIEMKWQFNGKKFRTDPIYIGKDWGIKEEIYEDFKKAAKIKKWTLKDFPKW